MRTTDRATTLLLLLVVAAAGPAHAQRVLFRVGGGALLASDVGVAGLASLEVQRGGLLLRAEGRPAYVVGRMEGGFAGAAIGYAASRATAGGRPYALGTLGRGLDVREADWATAAGLALGADFGGAPLFLELRYEHLFQDANRHNDLPQDQATLLLGLRIGRS